MEDEEPWTSTSHLSFSSSVRTSFDSPVELKVFFFALWQALFTAVR